MQGIDIKPDAQGKVRDLYDLGDKLLLVATDRISAFDYILKDDIPYKGQVLTQLSCFWFELLADVFALQETKLQEGQIDLDLSGYTQSWSYAERKGYSGTAVFSKEVPLQVIHEVGVPELDTEGRVVICEFEHLWFVNVYTPNSQNELARIDCRMHWDDVFREVCQGLEQGILSDGSKGNAKPVVMCGDFNVAHEPIDLKNPRTNVGNPGFSDEERAKFTALLEAGFVDTFRSLHPTTEGAYTWWSYRFNARANNAGWRIDYFLVSQALEQRVVMSCIWPEIMGSDHCPISLELDTEGWE